MQNRDIAWVSVWYRENTTSKPHTHTHSVYCDCMCVCVFFFLFSFSKLGQSKSVTQNTEQITVRKLGMHSRRVPGVLEFWNSIFYHVFFCILFLCTFKPITKALKYKFSPRRWPPDTRFQPVSLPQQPPFPWRSLFRPIGSCSCLAGFFLSCKRMFILFI